MGKITAWLKKNWLLVLIIVVGAFLRLYKIDQYMTFLGDEGRDAIIVRRLLVDFDPILIGPGTSIGNMYLGPLYYYMMAPALLLANFSPVGPAVMIALLGVVTVWFVWKIGKEWFGNAAGLVAAALYAVSPTVIIYSHSSWNPNIMPFFALLSIYSIWRVWRHKEFKWLLVLGVSYAFVLQSHYLGLLLVPVLFLFWFLSRPPLRYTVYSALIFLLLMSPLVIFDARHGWMNFNAMKTFFTARQATVSARPWNAIPKLYPQFEEVNTSLIGGKNKTAGKFASAVLLAGVILVLVKAKKTVFHTPHFLLLVWLGAALIGFGLYKQQIYDHYFGFIFPVPFLLAGALSREILNGKQKILKMFLFPSLFFLVFVNLANSPLRSSPNQQLRRSVEVTRKIKEESAGKRFNLAVLAERNYEDGYEYFLLKDELPVVDIDAQRPDTVTDQLFAVCELPKEKCDPTHSAKAEVANFGWSKIDGEWEVFGVRLYKLGHTQ